MDDYTQYWGQIDWESQEAYDSDGPPPGKYRFEVKSVKPGVDKNNIAYVSVGCVVLDGPAEGKMFFEFCSLDPKRLGFTKGFFTRIGAAGVFVKGSSPEDAIGTIFEGTVLLEEYNGVQRKKLRDLIAATGAKSKKPKDRPPVKTAKQRLRDAEEAAEDEEDYEEEEEGEEEEEEEEAPRMPKPKKPQMGGSRRRG